MNVWRTPNERSYTQKRTAATIYLIICYHRAARTLEASEEGGDDLAGMQALIRAHITTQSISYISTSKPKNVLRVLLKKVSKGPL